MSLSDTGSITAPRLAVVGTAVVVLGMAVLICLFVQADNLPGEQAPQALPVSADASAPFPASPLPESASSTDLQVTSHTKDQLNGTFEGSHGKLAFDLSVIGKEEVLWLRINEKPLQMRMNPKARSLEVFANGLILFPQDKYLLEDAALAVARYAKSRPRTESMEYFSALQLGSLLVYWSRAPGNKPIFNFRSP